MPICLNYLSQIEEVDLLKDRGFLVGDGVFETLRVEHGKVFWLSEHLERLSQHASHVKLSPPWAFDDVKQFVENNIPQDGLHRCRLTMTTGEGGQGYVRPLEVQPRLFVTHSPASPRKPLPLLKFCPHPVNKEMSAKTLSCMDRILFSPKMGEEWVMYREDNSITECTMANIFWVREGRLETPELNGSLLAGLTRQRIIKLANSLDIAVHVGDYPKETLLEADEIFITGTLAGIVPVEQIEHHKPRSRILITHISEAYKQVLAEEFARA